MRYVMKLILIGGLVTVSQAKELKFLEAYTGQSFDQIVAMESDYRVDSLVLALEQAIKQKKGKTLSQVEFDVLAVEAMEREVNNGGFHQFFSNSSQEYAADIHMSLDRIGCPVASKIAADALGYLKINGDITGSKINAALDRLGDKAIADLEEIDRRYYNNKEHIADKLFAYIKKRKRDISLK